MFEWLNRISVPCGTSNSPRIARSGFCLSQKGSRHRLRLDLLRFSSCILVVLLFIGLEFTNTVSLPSWLPILTENSPLYSMCSAPALKRWDPCRYQHIWNLSKNARVYECSLERIGEEKFRTWCIMNLKSTNASYVRCNCITHGVWESKKRIKYNGSQINLYRFTSLVKNEPFVVLM